MPDDSNGEVRFVIRGLEKFQILTEITILPFFRKLEFSRVLLMVSKDVEGYGRVCKGVKDVEAYGMWKSDQESSIVVLYILVHTRMS